MVNLRSLKASTLLTAAQVGLIYLLVLASICNISLNTGHTEIWLALLSGAAGLLTPGPKLSSNIERRESDSPIEVWGEEAPSVDEIDNRSSRSAVELATFSEEERTKEEEEEEEQEQQEEEEVRSQPGSKDEFR